MDELLAWLEPRVRVEDKGAVGPCWTWTLSLNHNGYARRLPPKRFGGRRVFIHRLTYEALRGPIPEGLQIDHICRNRACVNPDHLEPVTAEENSRRRPQNPLCPQGHLMIGDNVMLRLKGWRACRTCHQQRLLRARRSKGVCARGVRSCGEQNGRAKLTVEQVRQIRVSGETLQVLSRQFGVSLGTLSQIRNRKTWRHVT